MMKAVKWDQGQPEGWNPASRILFGSVVVISSVGAKTCKMVGKSTETNILGVADFSQVQKRVDSFYSPEDGTGLIEKVPILPGGSYCRFWATPNGANVNVDPGDYFQVADLGSSPTGTHGMLELVPVSGQIPAGKTKTATSIAQALESILMGSNTYKVPAADVNIGDATVTMTSGDVSKMGLRGGDPIIMENLNGDVRINRVRKIASNVITLQFPSEVDLVATDSDLITAPKQVLGRLL